MDLSSNSDDCLNFFFSLWPNRYLSIIRPLKCQNWVTVSKFHKLTDNEIYTAIDLTDSNFFGCRWGEQTRFAVLDIDTTSEYYNELGLARLRQTLSEIGLSGTLYQSSNSGGWHLYIFFDDWVNSNDVNKLLKLWLKEKGFKFSSGQLEMFPSGNGLRLPLQAGFAWLDQSGNLLTKREDLSTNEAIERFLADLEQQSNSFEFAQEAIEKLHKAPTYQEIEKSTDDFSDFFDRAGMSPDVYEKGRMYWSNGLTALGQRHDAVFSIGHYLWYGDLSENLKPLPYKKNASLRAQLILEWLEENHNGCSKAINSDRWGEVKDDIERACFWTTEEGQTKNYESYPLTDVLIDRLTEAKVYHIDDFKNENERRQTDARQRIKKAVEQCQATGQQITRNGLAEIAQCSKNTVSRHDDLWRHLTTGSDVLSGPDHEVSIDLIDSSLAVAPFLSCLAGAPKPTTCSNCQYPGLKPCIVLTAGSNLRGMQAGTAGGQRGIFICFFLELLALARGPPGFRTF